MNKEFQSFKQEMDNWVKDLNSQLNEYKNLNSLLNEHTDNIDHNYEILQEMRAEVCRLKEEVSALRLVQLLQLKSEMQNTKRH